MPTALGALKKVLFRERAKHPRLQRLWSRLHTMAVFGMNYGGGAVIESSGEEWVVANVLGPACAGAQPPLVFDVGANVGDYALLVRRYFPSAIVYAFEPSAQTYRQLERNLAGGGDGFRTFNLGLSDGDRDAVLYSYTVEGQEAPPISSVERRLPTQALRVEVSGSEPVRLRSLDGFCESEGVGRIDFLKLDVEGHELAVLRGARRMLEAGAISIIQFEFGPADIYARTFFYDFWSLLAGDYDLFRIIPKGVAPIPFYGEHLEIFLTTNYLAIRKRGG